VSKIYVISGSTGEYSDRTEWLVEAHSTEVAAQARINQLDELMLELNVDGNGSYMYEQRAAAEKAMRVHPKGDPYFRLDYTGSSYSYAEC